MAEGDSGLIRDVNKFLAKDNQKNTEIGLRTGLARSLEEQLVLRIKDYKEDAELPPYTKIEKWSDKAFAITSTVLESSLDGIGSKSVSLVHTPEGVPLIAKGLRKYGIEASGMVLVGLHTDKLTEQEARKAEVGGADTEKFNPGTGYIYDEKADEYHKIVNIPMGVEKNRPVVGRIMGTDYVLEHVEIEDLKLLEEILRALNGEVELG